MTEIWSPLPGTQSLALDARVDELLLYGSRGASKSATQVMKYLRHVGLGYGAFWRGVIIDTEFKSLADIIAQTQKFFYGYNDGAKYLAGTSNLMWYWPTGEKLLFSYAKKLKDYDKFHGHEYPFIGYNELSKHPTPDLYNKINSTNRCSFIPELHTPKNVKGEYLTPDKKPLPPIPLIILSTTNPSGVGRQWVKKKFIDPVPVGTVLKKETQIHNPRTGQKEIVVKKQLALFCSYKENKYLPAQYVADLENIKDPNLRSAWLHGSWDNTSGGAFDDLWDSHKHVIPRSKIPSDWYVDRAFDWGSTHPFSVGWFAQANGEEMILSDGSVFCPPSGTIIQIDEWYGSDDIGSNKGTMLSPTSLAAGILETEKQLIKDGWIRYMPHPGPADNQIGEVRYKDVPSIESKMHDAGVKWTKSDKSRGSRINGFQLFRERLQSTLDKEGQGFYVMDNCRATLEIVPYLPRGDKNPDDVETTSEDHIWDMIRYRVLASTKVLAKSLPTTFAY